MSVTKAFYDAVHNNDVLSVHIMMKDSLLLEPTFKDFDAMEQAAQNMEGLYQPHDGRPFITDCSQWNDAYMSKQMVQVVSNFSRERVAHLKEVVRYLRPVEEKKASERAQVNRRSNYDARSAHVGHLNATHNTYQDQKRRDQEEGRYIRPEFAVGVVAGAAVGAAVAYAASVTIAGGAVVGAVVGGTAATVLRKK